MATIKLTANEKAFVTSMENATGAVGRLSAELNIKLARAMRETDAMTNQLRKGIGRVGEQMQNVGQKMTQYLTLPMLAFGGVAAKFYGDIDSLKRGLDTYGLSLEKVKEIAKAPGLGLEEVGKTMVTFASVRYNATLAEKAVKEFGNALTMTGKGKAELEGIAVAFAQMKGKGQVQAEELNQIAERLPMIRDLMQQAFGTSDTKVLQDKGIGGDVFLQKIVEQLEKLPRASAGFKTAWENVIDSLKIGSYEIFKAADNAFKLTEKLNALSNWIDMAVERFRNLSPEVQKTIFVIGGMVAIAGPLITAFGFFTSTIVPAFLTGVGAISAPVLAVGAVVAIVVANIVKYWDNLKAVLVNTGIWKGISAVASVGLNLLGDVVGIFINLFTADWSGLWENIKNIAKRAWNAVVEAAAFGAKMIIGVNKKIFEFIGLDSLAKGAGNVINAIDGLTSKIKADVPASTSNLEKLANALSKVTGSDKPILPTGEKKETQNYDGIKGERVSPIKLSLPETLKYFLEYGQTIEQASNNLQIKLSKIGEKVKFDGSGLLSSLDLFRMELSQKLNETISNSVEAFAYALGSGGGLVGALRAGFATVLNAIGQYMIDMGKKFILAQELISKAKLLFGTGPQGWVAALALVAGGAAIKGIANNYVAPRFAAGGMVTGPTYAIMGDNPSGKEMALPWEKTGIFADAIAKRMGGGAMVIPDIRLQGKDLVIAFRRAEKEMNNA